MFDFLQIRSIIFRNSGRARELSLRQVEGVKVFSLEPLGSPKGEKAEG